MGVGFVQSDGGEDACSTERKFVQFRQQERNEREGDEPTRTGARKVKTVASLRER